MKLTGSILGVDIYETETLPINMVLLVPRAMLESVAEDLWDPVVRSNPRIPKPSSQAQQDDKKWITTTKDPKRNSPEDC